VRIAFDLQGAQNGSKDRGIGRYVSAFSRALINNRGEHEIILILNALFPNNCTSVREAFEPLPQHCSFAVFHGIGPTCEHDDSNHWRLQVSELMYRKFVADLSVDVLITGSAIEGFHDNTVTDVGTAPVNAAILYDLIPLINPDDHLRTDEARRWYSRRVGQLKETDILLAISESSRQEAIAHLAVPATRIVNIRGAASSDFLNLDLDDRRTNPIFFDLLKRCKINRPYLMHTSAFDKRKNFDGLIRAYAALPQAIRNAYQLLLVCKITDKDRSLMRQLVSSLGLAEDDVIFPGHVSDDNLITFYANCALFVFPSFHEGFGLPILEAMHCGAPVIGSNVSSVPEVIGNDRALFDPTSIADIANSLERVLSDPAELGEFKRHSAMQAKAFDWDTTARIALQAIEEVAHGKISSPRMSIALADVISAISQIDRPAQWDQRQLAGVAIALAKNEEVAARFQ
jgi:glycosyltransferase involved in cell wall biosynthesis